MDLLLAQKAWKTALRALQEAEAAFAAILAGNVRAALGRSVVNSAAVGAGASIVAPSAADFAAGAASVVSSTTPRVRISGGAFLRCSAVDQAITAQYVRDPAGANTPIGPIMTCDSSHVNANALPSLPDFYDTPGAAVRVYAVRYTTIGQTVTVLAANEAMITATPTL